MRIAKGVVVVLILAGVVHAQDKAVSPNADPLAALTAEVRLLRLATEKASQVQTQIQGLGIYLTAQQSRLVHLSGRLDAARAELKTAANQVLQFSDRIARLEDKSLPQDAAEAKAMMSTLKKQLASASGHEAQLRSQESELAAELQTELGRWTDLTSRLEQLIKQ